MDHHVRRALTKIEDELLGFLKHARGCDGRTNDSKVCPICRRIDRQLLDGSRYAIEDRQEREDILRRALTATLKISNNLASALEGAPVQPATRKSALQLAEWIGKIIFLLDAPITGGSKREVTAVAAEVTIPRIPEAAPSPPVVPFRRRERVKVFVVRPSRVAVVLTA